MSTSGTITLVVGDLAPPTAAILFPDPNAAVAPGQAVTVVVQAQDNQAVAAVALTTTGVLTTNQAQVMAPPSTPVTVTFTLTVPADAAANGRLELRAQALDLVGNAERGGDAVAARAGCPGAGSGAGCHAALHPCGARRAGDRHRDRAGRGCGGRARLRSIGCAGHSGHPNQ